MAEVAAAEEEHGAFIEGGSKVGGGCLDGNHQIGTRELGKQRCGVGGVYEGGAVSFERELGEASAILRGAGYDGGEAVCAECADELTPMRTRVIA